MKFLLMLFVFVSFTFSEVYDQRAAAIGPQNCIHGGNIYAFNGGGLTWSTIQGSARKVTFNYDGDMFVINNQCMVYRRYGTGGWQYMGTVPGSVRDIDAHSDVLGPVVSTSTGVYVRNVSGQWVISVNVGNIHYISCSGYAIYGLRSDGYMVKYINGSQAGVYAPPSGTSNFHDISVGSNGDVYASYTVGTTPCTIYKLDNMTSVWTTTVNPGIVFDVSLFYTDPAQAIVSHVYDKGVAYWCDKLQGTNLISSGLWVANLLDVAVGDGSYPIASPQRIYNLDGLKTKSDTVFFDK